MKARFTLALVSALLLIGGASSAGGAELPRGVDRAIKIDRFTMSGRQGIKWAADGIRGAKKDVVGEIFAISDKSVVSALHDRLENKVPVRGNADPQNIAKKQARQLIKAGADFRPWGGNAIRDGEYHHAMNPRMVHAKFLAFDHRAWLSTASLHRDAPDSVDATALVSGTTAAVTRKITERSHAGDEAGVHKAADEARTHGVLLNDSALGIRHLTEGMHDVIDLAKDELVLSTKVLESVDFAKRLSAAAARGVKVTLLTHPSKMSPEAKAALSPDIHVAGDPLGVLHANMIIADRKVGIFGSAHAKRRALGEPSWRASREMGFVVDDHDVLAEMHQTIFSLVDKAVPFGPHGHGP